MNAFTPYLLAFFVLLSLAVTAQKKNVDSLTTVYSSDRLVITQLSKNAYVHTSYFQSESWGKVPCNGMVVADSREVVIFDTPTGDSSAAELLAWIKDSLQSRVKAVIPTHFHEDCVGGLKEFHKANILSFGTYQTIAFARQHGFEPPAKGFKKKLVLTVGNNKAEASFLGEGHTKDNIVGYLRGADILFGGCLVKELKAGKGNLDDANVKAWSRTVEKVKKKYPHVQMVIPGHGAVGNASLLDYTIQLFRGK